jgi:protein O-mannosyl-transferase
LPKALICVLLAVLVFLAFSPVLRDGFTGYDDPDYVTNNEHVKDGLTPRNAAWAFTHAHADNWHPVTWLSHQLDCSLFGLDPTGHHLTSLLLHGANTILLFLWLSGATGARWRSAFVAAVFGVHPLHVESVTWIAERKDVLSGLFWMLTLLAYEAYARRPGVWRYALVVALFAGGLMAKPMVVTLPLVMIILDWWPLRRPGGWRLVLEKLPLAAMAGASSAVTLWAQRQAMDRLPLDLRLSNAAVSYIRYLWKTLWPAKLAVFYPFPWHGISPWLVAASVAAVCGLSAAAWMSRGRRPWLATGWLWYLVTLVPVIGIVQVGMQAMADRYMYLPMIGLLMAAAWQWPAGWRREAAIAAGVVVVACSILTWQQAQVWKDGVTLFTHALAVTQDNFVAHDNLGVELDRLGRPEEALAEYRETIRIRPGDRHGEANFAMASFAKGERLFRQQRFAEALAAFREGLPHQPANAIAHLYAGSALAQLGRTQEAGREFKEAVRSDPSNAEARYDLGLVLAALGQYAEARLTLEELLRLRPDYAAAREALRRMP